MILKATKSHEIINIKRYSGLDNLFINVITLIVGDDRILLVPQYPTGLEKCHDHLRPVL